MSMSFVAAGPEKIREIYSEAKALLWLVAIDALIEREQDAAFDAVRLVQEEERRSHEGDVATGIRHLLMQVTHRTRGIGNTFDEEPQIGLRILRTPWPRTIAVNDADRGDAAQLISGLLEPVLIARPRPEVVRSGRIPGTPRDVRCRGGIEACH